METVQFLSDIDNEKVYAARLELAYNCAYQELLKILIDFPYGRAGRVEVDELERCTGWIESDGKIKGQLEQMKIVMRLQIRQMAERRRRLADVAVGLTDGVLHEEST